MQHFQPLEHPSHRALLVASGEKVHRHAPGDPKDLTAFSQAGSASRRRGGWSFAKRDIHSSALWDANPAPGTWGPVSEDAISPSTDLANLGGPDAITTPRLGERPRRDPVSGGPGARRQPRLASCPWHAPKASNKGMQSRGEQRAMVAIFRFRSGRVDGHGRCETTTAFGMS